MSVAVPVPQARAAADAGLGRLIDVLLLANMFTVTFAKLRWAAGGPDVNISDIAASAFILAFAADRVRRRDGRVPRTAAVLGGLFALFLLVYLVGFYNLETVADRTLFLKGIVKFAVHFGFLICAVAHLATRSQSFYWRTLGWFVAGLAANGAYGVVQLAVAETTGANLDRTVLTPIGSYQRGGINVYGAVDGESVFRTNALTLDPNHLAIMLIVPLLVLLAIYLRLERDNRWRAPLALVLAFLAVVEVSTLSRSGLLGFAAGLVVLAIPYRRALLSRRLLAPAGLVLGALAVVVSQRAAFFETVIRSRTALGGGSTRVHLELYELLPPVIGEHPLFGLGLNTFSTYYEFITGESNWGPHSYYVAVLAETGLVGTALFLVYLAYVFSRLRRLHAIGRELAHAGDPRAAKVRPLSFGLTAALVGTLVANAFYLTMQMYYFFAFAILILAAPLVFARREPDPVGARASL